MYKYFLIFLLAGCSSFSSSTPFPELPKHLSDCADILPVDIPPGDKSRAEVVELLAQVRKSELQGRRCASDLAAWYEDLLRSPGDQE